MNNGLQRILSALLALIAIYFLAWPFLNGVMSHRNYIKSVTEGSPNSVYISEFGRDEPLSVRVEHYNNLATQASGNDTTENTYEIESSVEEKLEKVANYYRGGHLIFRYHAGYAFWYDDNASSVDFIIPAATQKEVLSFSKILENLSKGDTKISNKDQKTYYELGKEQLDEFIDKLDLM